MMQQTVGEGALVIWVVVWILFAVFSALLANAKNRSVVGWFFVGLFFGPFGLLVAFFPAIADAQHVPEGSRACPYCAELIKTEALVCRYCNKDLTTSTRKEVGGIVVSE